MKRCTECGYRIKADLRRCPVCDGKMTDENDLHSSQLHEKSHKAEGAPCLLNQKPSKPSSFMEMVENETIKSRWIHASAVPIRFVPVILILILMLIQSCSK